MNIKNILSEGASHHSKLSQVETNSRSKSRELIGANVTNT